MKTDLATALAEVARREGDRPALIGPGAQIGFAELERRAAAFAETCKRAGLGKGDRVLVAMPVGADLFVALAAAWRCGAVVVFPEPAMGLGGVRHAARTTRPKMLFASGSYRWLQALVPALWRCRRLAPAVSDRGTGAATPVQPEDHALISFTSGSTGRPKAIARSHGFLAAQHAAVAPVLDAATPQTDLVAFPVFTLVNLAAGRTSVLPNWKSSRAEAVTPQALSDWLKRTGCTRALLPPALCETLAKAPIPAPLHTVFTGGGPVKPRLVAALKRQKPGLKVISVYGSTEAEPVAVLDWDDVGLDDLAAMGNGNGLLAGRPVPGLALRLKDDEIQVAGPHVNPGYLDPAMNAGNKILEGDTIWHRTGDAGRLDDGGRLWLLGRHAAIVPTAHGRLYPFAVETAAEAWPGVHRAALIQVGGAPALAIQGDRASEPAWRTEADRIGVPRVVHVNAMPVDPRHRSKIDYPKLTRMLRA